MEWRMSRGSGGMRRHYRVRAVALSTDGQRCVGKGTLARAATVAECVMEVIRSKGVSNEAIHFPGGSARPVGGAGSRRFSGAEFLCSRTSARGIVQLGQLLRKYRNLRN